MRKILATLLLCAIASLPAGATVKKEFAHSAALKSWFKNAQPTDWAQKQYYITYCCEQAERVKTRFDVVKAGEGIEQWWFECTEETAAFCTNRGKKLGEWAQIPPGVVHKEQIEDPKKFPASDGSVSYVGEVEAVQVHNEFEQLRQEGVMFVYRGDIVCFWAPEFTG
jgi:hypothetical protein